MFPVIFLKKTDKNSTEKFLLLIPVSDCLIFCCANLILHKKRNENDKNTFFNENEQ